MSTEDDFIRDTEIVPQVNEQVGWKYINSTTNDKVFKEMFAYKMSAAIVLKNCIPEYRELHPRQIIRLIKDNTDRGEQSDDEIAGTKIDLLSSDNASMTHLSTEEDLVFSAYTDESREQWCLITIDLEMQNKFTQTSPNIVSRGMYYVATELIKTVPSGNSKYDTIHKVYSIWLCAEKVVLSGFEQIGGADFYRKEHNINFLYKHRFKMCRFYDEIPEHTYHGDIEADLMEVDLFDLTVLQSKVTAGQADKGEEALIKVLYDIPEAPKFIRDEYGINLTKYEEGVNKIMSLAESNELLEKKVEEKEKELEEERRLKEEERRLKEEERRLKEEKEKEVEELRRQLAALQQA